MIGRSARQQWRHRAAAITDRLPLPFHRHVPPDHQESAQVRSRRRKVVSVIGLAGAGLLGASLSTRPGSKRFYVLTLSVAGTWAAGALASGPLHLGRVQLRNQTTSRPVVVPIATGLGAFAFFYGCALVARRMPLLDDAISGVLRYADKGAAPWVVLTTGANGIAEELFFRGALFAAVPPRHPVASTTAAYVLATAATRNPALVLAGAVMGTLFALQRQASGGIQAPILTHLTWSMLMLKFLPPLFRRSTPGSGS